MPDHVEDDLLPPAEFGDDDTPPETLPQEPQEPDEPPAGGEGEPAEKHVPLAALKEVREENKTLKAKLAEVDSIKAQLAQMQQPQQQPLPPIPPTDPRFGAVMQAQIEQRLVKDRLATSRFLAEREFGADTVAEAYAYFDQHPQESLALLNEASPFHAAVEHFKRQKAAAEIGSDPVAYRQRVEAEIRQQVLAELAKEGVKPSRGPSLAGNTNLGSRVAQEWAGPTPLDDILKP